MSFQHLTVRNVVGKMLPKALLLILVKLTFETGKAALISAGTIMVTDIKTYGTKNVANVL